MRACCDPCGDPDAVTLRSGARVVHLTNLYRGSSWGPIDFAFYDLLDPLDPESGPDTESPVDLTGSTWVMEMFPIDDAEAPAFVAWDVDTADQATGVIHVAVPDASDTVAAAVGADCAPTYVYTLTQVRDGVPVVVIIGTAQVTDAHTLLAV